MNIIKELKNSSWVGPYLKKYKGLLTLTIILGVLTFFCGSALMFTSGYTIDKAATRPENILMIYVPIVLTRAFGIGRPVFRYLERLVSHDWVLKVTSNLRVRLYKILEKDASYFNEKYKTGEILGLLSEDINHLQNLFLNTIFPTIIAYIVTIIVTLGIGHFSWQFGLIILFLFLVEITFVPLLSLSIESARRTRQKSLKSKLYTDFTDNVLGANDWIISGRKDDFFKSSKETLDELNQSKEDSLKFSHRRDFSLQVIFGVIVLALLAFTNLKFTGNQEQANWVSAFILAIFPLNDAIIPVSGAYDEWPEYKDSMHRLENITPTERNLPAQKDFDPQDFKEINIDNISFKYEPNSTQLITNFSQKLTKGSKTAIIGPSGSGKTTILQLLLGDLKPDEGNIYINDNNVLELQDVRHQLFSVLNQEPFLFNTTIMNNVRMGNKNVSDDEVKDAIAKVGLKDLVESLPNKYDTLVEESGNRFSGGQKERLALARIILQKAPIVLLDEPTTGLDPITEKKLLDTFFETLSDRTIVWVTHHLHNIGYADRVILLSENKIEMNDSPQNLYKNNKHFQELYKLDQGL